MVWWNSGWPALRAMTASMMWGMFGWGTAGSSPVGQVGATAGFGASVCGIDFTWRGWFLGGFCGGWGSLWITAHRVGVWA